MESTRNVRPDFESWCYHWRFFLCRHIRRCCVLVSRHRRSLNGDRRPNNWSWRNLPSQILVLPELRMPGTVSTPHCIWTYSRITSIKSPLFCMTTFSASLTNLTALLPQSHNYSYYVSRPILAPPPLWLQKNTDLRTHDFTHSPDLWQQPRFAYVTCAWSWWLCGITSAITTLGDIRFQPQCSWGLRSSGLSHGVGW
jgi:hypothetical protein